MARQMTYPAHYPNNPALTTREACWEFLCLNQHTASEALVVFMNSEFNRLENTMAARRTAQNKKPNNQNKATWAGFANISLTDGDKEAIRGGILDGDTVLAIFAGMLGDGHKVTLSYDPERDTVNLAITGHYEFCPNAGLTMTSFARDITSAMEVAAYKHEIVAKGDWSKFVQTARPKEDFG